MHGRKDGSEKKRRWAVRMPELVNGSNSYLGLISAPVSLFPSAARSLGIIRATASTADTLINCTRRQFKQF